MYIGMWLVRLVLICLDFTMQVETKKANKGKGKEGRKRERGKNREKCLNGRRTKRREEKWIQEKTEGLK